MPIEPEVTYHCHAIEDGAGHEMVAETSTDKPFVPENADQERLMAAVFPEYPVA